MKKDSSDYLTLDIEKLLEFYDEKGEAREHGSNVGAINGLIGEDLVLGALEHCWGEDNVTRDDEKETPRGMNAWLDAWFVHDEKCYQIEVKNWSASSFGGRSVTNMRTGRRELVETAHYNFAMYLDHPRNAKTVWKVLKKMNNPPPNCGKPIPLLAFWSPIASPQRAKEESALEPLFNEPIAEHMKAINSANIIPGDHTEVMIFSASLYLRQLQGKLQKEKREPVVALYMPRAARRLRHLRNLGLKLS